MKIFLTGGTGFIGSHFINEALSRGIKVVALRRSKLSKPKIPLFEDPLWLDKGMDEVVREDFWGCDILVHLAAHSANLPYDTLEQCIHWNVNIPLKLFRCAVAADLNNFIIAGSCFEYGDSGMRYDLIPTDAPLEPTLSYPASKAMASIAFSQFAKELKLNLKILRIFQVYGEGEAENRLWPSLKKAALAGQDFYLTKGEQIRDFSHVSKVVEELVIGVEKSSKEKNFFEIQNVGTGQSKSLREFVEYWWKTWDAKGKLYFGSKPYRDGEIMRYIPKL